MGNCNRTRASLVYFTESATPLEFAEETSVNSSFVYKIFLYILSVFLQTGIVLIRYGQHMSVLRTAVVVQPVQFWLLFKY